MIVIFLHNKRIIILGFLRASWPLYHALFNKKY